MTEEQLDDYDESELYMSFEDFREWLDKYNFVRSMIVEALMPKMWSLTDKYMKN